MHAHVLPLPGKATACVSACHVFSWHACAGGLPVLACAGMPVLACAGGLPGQPGALPLAGAHPAHEARPQTCPGPASKATQTQRERRGHPLRQQACSWLGTAAGLASVRDHAVMASQQPPAPRVRFSAHLLHQRLALLLVCHISCIAMHRAALGAEVRQTGCKVVAAARAHKHLRTRERLRGVRDCMSASRRQRRAPLFSLA